MKLTKLFSILVVFVLAATMVTPAGAASITTQVNASTAGWGFAAETGTGTGSFVAGPGTPPLGAGSAQLNTAVDADGTIFASQVPLPLGTRLDAITALSYSTYRSTVDAGNNLAVALQLNIDYDVTDGNTAYQGRLVYEPYINTPGGVPQNTWQTWNTLAGKWWASGAPGNATCTMGSPCTMAQILTNWPNAGVHPTMGALVFKAGSNWDTFSGNVDNLVVGYGGNTTTYDFEANLAPVITINPTTKTQNENANAIIDSTATVTDGDSADFDTGKLTIAVSPSPSGTDNIFFNAAGAITRAGSPAGTVSYSGVVFANYTGYNTPTLTFTFNANATPAYVDALVKLIRYQEPNNAPVAPLTRTVTFTLTDGDGGSGVDSIDITITSINDPIAVNGWGVPDPTYTENDAPMVLDSDANVTLTDPDTADLTGATVTVSFALNGALEDQLTIQPVGLITTSGSDVLYNGTIIGTFTGGTNGSALVVTLNNAATNTSNDALARAFAYSNTSDNPSTLTRTVRLRTVESAATSQQDKLVYITAVNDAPTGGNDSVTTAEDTLYTFAVSDFTYSDAESNPFAGIKITSLETAGTLQCNSADVAADDYCADVTTLTFMPDLNASGTPYATFEFMVFDGTDYSAASYTMTINVDAGNDDPTLVINPTDLSVNENTNLIIDAAALVSDLDSTNFDTGTLTIAETASLSASQNITFNTGSGFTRSGATDGSTVSYTTGGVTNVIGTFTGLNTPNLVFTFNANATPAIVELLVRRIVFNDPDSTPDPTVRVVVFTLTDGDGGTASDSVNITVNAVNDQPNIGGISGVTSGVPWYDTVTWVESNPPAPVYVDLGQNASSSDGDSPNLDGGKLTITIANFQTGDVLVAQNYTTIIKIVGTDVQRLISGSYVSIGTITQDGSAGVLEVTFNASALPAHAGNIIRGVGYYNTSDAPDTTQRILQYVLTDGDDNTAPADGTSVTRTSYVNITATNDAPVCKDVSITTEKNVAGSVAPNCSDPDVTDTLTYSVGTATNGTPSVDASNNLVYTPNTDYIGGDTFTYTANDGTVDSAPANVTVTVEDTTAPETNIDSTVPATTPTNVTSITINFSANEAATFQCRMYLATDPAPAYAACTSPFTQSGLADGDYVFEVYATDTTGNPDATPEKYTWTVDTGLPLVSIGAPSLTLTNVGPVDFPITITGATTINLTSADVTLTPTGTVTGTINVSNGTTATPTVTVSAITGNGTFTISIAAGVASDDAANESLAAGPSSVVTVDNSSLLTTEFTGLPKDVLVSNGQSFPASFSFTAISVKFNKDVYNPASDFEEDDVTNPANYLLVAQGDDRSFETKSCDTGAALTDKKITTGPVTYDPATFVATVQVNGGSQLPDGYYRLFVCGTTSIVDLAGNVLNNGQDVTLDFSFYTPVSPATGFAQGKISYLPAQPIEKAYTSTEMELYIPALNKRTAIVGVPKLGNGWDVTWLGQQAGYLDGTSFPTWDGNSVITGHVWDAYNNPGVFANLKSLKYGDKIVINAFGKVYTYEVRENRMTKASNTTNIFKHEKMSWITLVTCENFNEKTGSYPDRRYVRAVLVSVTTK